MGELQAKLDKAATIFRLAEVCRRLETEQEKVRPRVARYLCSPMQCYLK